LTLQPATTHEAITFVTTNQQHVLLAAAHIVFGLGFTLDIQLLHTQAQDACHSLSAKRVQTVATYKSKLPNTHRAQDLLISIMGGCV
jgi:hypothetical protein